MAAKLYNLARMTVSGTPGTGDITLLSAVSGYLTFALAGAANGETVTYAIKDGANSEIGRATYNSAGPTLSGRTVLASTNSNAAISASSAAEVFISPAAEDVAFVASNMPAGMVLQCLQNTYVTNTNLSTALPYDDTVPQSTEGTEVLSQAITPRNANSKFLVFATVFGDTDVQSLNVALFRGTTCINAAAANQTTEANVPLQLLDAPASASAQTYSVRVGPTSGNTARLNGTTSARRFGGTSTCALTVMEIAG